MRTLTRTVVADAQAELNAYSEKFDAVQETLGQTNGLFTTFRDEMDKARGLPTYWCKAASSVVSTD